MTKMVFGMEKGGNEDIKFDRLKGSLIITLGVAQHIYGGLDMVGVLNMVHSTYISMETICGT